MRRDLYMLTLIASAFLTATISSSQDYNCKPLDIYIRPSLANYIDAPLPQTSSSDQLLGLYLNILYPQDNEQIQQKKLADWIENLANDPETPFCFSQEELKDFALYLIDSFPLTLIRHYFAQNVHDFLADGQSLENAFIKAKHKTLLRALVFKTAAQNIPAWEGRCEILKEKLLDCSGNIEKVIELDMGAIIENPSTTLRQILNKTAIDLIKPPYTWDIRMQVFREMIDKITATSPDSPYFLALQEVTPEALSNLKEMLADRNFTWVSFNNMSGKKTLAPKQEETLGEAVEYTSTIALSPGLEVLKCELGDLPTESDHLRRILGVRIRNTSTNKVYNVFTTHTDYNIRNNIYERTASKLYEFAFNFLQDDQTSAERFLIGGDLNSFTSQGGDKYIEKLRTLFPGCRDFRETDYYAPYPIAWSSFIGRYEDTYTGRIAKDGIMEPNSLDHILVGKEIELHSAAREALVYDDSGRLLDYYKEKDKYMEYIQKGVTFSDHFMNIIRFK